MQARGQARLPAAAARRSQLVCILCRGRLGAQTAGCFLAGGPPGSAPCGGSLLRGRGVTSDPAWGKEPCVTLPSTSAPRSSRSVHFPLLPNEVASCFSAFHRDSEPR